jgi:hypothetical protein
VKALKVYYTTFRGRFLGGEAIILARYKAEAKKLLKEKMRLTTWDRHGKKLQEEYDTAAHGMVCLSDEKDAHVYYFYDGDY